MKLKALVTTLVLGSSSLALAAPGPYARTAPVAVRDHRAQPAPPPLATPVFERDHRMPDRDRDRDHDRDGRKPIVQRETFAPVWYRPASFWQASFQPMRYRPVVYQPRWSLLSTSNYLTRGTASISLQARALTTLELKAQRGATRINTVVITFGNGQRQAVRLNKVLRANASARIDLAGNTRNVAGIQVFGRGGRYATFQVLGK